MTSWRMDSLFSPLQKLFEANVSLATIAFGCASMAEPRIVEPLRALPMIRQKVWKSLNIFRSCLLILFVSGWDFFLGFMDWRAKLFVEGVFALLRLLASFLTHLFSALVKAFILYICGWFLWQAIRACLKRLRLLCCNTPRVSIKIFSHLVVSRPSPLLLQVALVSVGRGFCLC